MNIVHIEWTELSLFLICIVYQIMGAKKMSKLMDKLNDSFIYGLLIGFFLVMEGIVSVQGLYATLKEYQVHYVTLMWIDAMGIWFYYNQPKDRELKKKVLFTFLFVLWFFEAHDWFWLIQTHFSGIWLSPTLIIWPDQVWYFIAYSRYIALSVPLTFILWKTKHFHFDKKFWLLLSIQLIYHAVISYTNYPANFLTLIPDTLPSLFLVWKKKK